MNLTTIKDKKSILLSNIYPTLHSPSTLSGNVIYAETKGMYQMVMAFSFDLPNGDIAHITESIMAKYNITFPELISAINQNPYNYVFEKLSSFLGIEDDAPLYVLTNSNTHYGAGALCINRIMQHIIDTIQDDFYIFPSSVHELIIAPVTSLEFNKNELPRMVHTINQEVVESKDRLSNHVYYLNYKEKSITTIPYTE